MAVPTLHEAVDAARDEPSPPKQNWVPQAGSPVTAGLTTKSTESDAALVLENGTAESSPGVTETPASAASGLPLSSQPPADHVSPLTRTSVAEVPVVGADLKPPVMGSAVKVEGLSSLPPTSPSVHEPVVSAGSAAAVTPNTTGSKTDSSKKKKKPKRDEKESTIRLETGFPNNWIMPIIKAGVPDNFMISSGAKTAIQVLSFLLSHPLLCDACHTTQHTDLESLLIYIHDECISRPLFLPQKTQRCVTEFISFITSEVTDSPQFNKTKAITGADILQAMRHLGYEDYALCAEKFGHKWLSKFAPDLEEKEARKAEEAERQLEIKLMEKEETLGVHFAQNQRQIFWDMYRENRQKLKIERGEPLSLPSRDWSKVDMEKMTPLYERFAGSELDGTVIARVLKETRKVSPKKKSKEKALAEGGAHAPTLEGVRKQHDQHRLSLFGKGLSQVTGAGAAAGASTSVRQDVTSVADQLQVSTTSPTAPTPQAASAETQADLPPKQQPFDALHSFFAEAAEAAAAEPLPAVSPKKSKPVEKKRKTDAELEEEKAARKRKRQEKQERKRARQLAEQQRLAELQASGHTKPAVLAQCVDHNGSVLDAETATSAPDVNSGHQKKTEKIGSGQKHVSQKKTNSQNGHKVMKKPKKSKNQQAELVKQLRSNPTVVAMIDGLPEEYQDPKLDVITQFQKAWQLNCLNTLDVAENLKAAILSLPRQSSKPSTSKRKSTHTADDAPRAKKVQHVSTDISHPTAASSPSSHLPSSPSSGVPCQIQQRNQDSSLSATPVYVHAYLAETAPGSGLPSSPTGPAALSALAMSTVSSASIVALSNATASAGFRPVGVPTASAIPRASLAVADAPVPSDSVSSD